MDDEFILNNDNLINYSIRHNIFDNIEFIVLSIETDNGFFKYKIFRDTREPDLEIIETHLNEVFNGLRNLNINQLQIYYWDMRNYLFVRSYSNKGEMGKQYTAHKLPMDILDTLAISLRNFFNFFKKNLF